MLVDAEVEVVVWLDLAGNGNTKRSLFESFPQHLLSFLRVDFNLGGGGQGLAEYVMRVQHSLRITGVLSLPEHLRRFLQCPCPQRMLLLQIRFPGSQYPVVLSIRCPWPEDSGYRARESQRAKLMFAIMSELQSVIHKPNSLVRVFCSNRVPNCMVGC